MNIKFLSAAIVLCLAAGQAQAYDFYSGGILFNILSNTSTRKTAAVTYATTTPDETGYISTYKGDIVIPAQVSWNMQTFNVTQIGDLAMFDNQAVYTVTLPEGVTSIGRQAFSHCYSMYEITIPSTVTRIADYAFEYCEDLASITLPASLGQLGEGAFQQCYGLTSVEVEEGNPEFKSVGGVLYGGVNAQSGMTLLVYPGSSVESSYEIAEGTKAINTYALSANTTLRNLTLPASLRIIEDFSFSECEALESFEVAEENDTFRASEGVLFTADGKTLFQYPVVRPGLDYEVPEGVERLGEMSFAQVRSLANLTLPASLTVVGPLAFFANQALVSVTSRAIVPPAVETSMILPGVGMFEDVVFYTAPLFVPEESVEAYRNAPGWGQFRTIVPIGTDLSGIDDLSATSDPASFAYDLQGRPAAPATRGLILERRGNKTVKTLRR